MSLGAVSLARWCTSWGPGRRATRRACGRVRGVWATSFARADVRGDEQTSGGGGDGEGGQEQGEGTNPVVFIIIWYDCRTPEIVAINRRLE